MSIKEDIELKEIIDTIKSAHANNINHIFLTKELIENIENEKIENRKIRSVIDFNVGQFFVKATKTITTGNSNIDSYSKYYIEKKANILMNKTIINTILGGTFVLGNFDTGFELYKYISSSEYYNDLLSITNDIIKEVLPIIDVKITELKGFLKNKDYVFNILTNGLIAFFGLYFNSKESKVSIVDDILKDFKKAVKNKNIPSINPELNDLEFKYINKSNLFLSDFLFRFNFMYEVLKKKIEKKGIIIKEFLINFSKKIFTDFKLYKNITNTYINKENESAFDSNNCINTQSNIKKYNGFNKMFKLFDNYIITFDELKDYGYEEKIKIFKEIVEKSEKDNEENIIKMILINSVKRIYDISISLNIKNYYFEKINEKETLKNINEESQIIKKCISNIVKISKISDYVSKNKENSNFIELSLFAKTILDYMKNGENLIQFTQEISSELNFNISGFLKNKMKTEIINNMDFNLMKKEKEKENKLKIILPKNTKILCDKDIYVLRSSNDIEDYKIKLDYKINFIDVFYGNIFEYFYKNKINKIEENQEINKILNIKSEKDFFCIDNFHKNEFNNDIYIIINKMILFLSDLTKNFKSNDNNLKKIELIYEEFKKTNNMESFKYIQKKYLEFLLDIAKHHFNVKNNVLDPKYLILSLLEENKKIEELKMLNNLNNKKINYIEKVDNLSFQVKSSILELIIKEKYDYVFPKNNQNMMFEQNISNELLIQKFFNLLILKEGYLKKAEKEQKNKEILKDFGECENYSVFFEKLKFINNNEFETIFQNLMNKDDLIKDYICKKIKIYKSNIKELDNIKISNYCIEKIKIGNFILFDDNDHTLVNLVNSKDREEVFKENAELDSILHNLNSNLQISSITDEDIKKIIKKIIIRK